MTARPPTGSGAGSGPAAAASGPAEHPAHSSTPSGVLAASAAVAAWGGGNALIASVPLSGLALAFWRLGFGVLLYVPILYLRGGRLGVRSFRHGWAGGAVFGANIMLFFVALRLTSVANATTISALQPLVIMLFAGAMFGERIGRRHVLGGIAAIAGVALVTFGAADTDATSLEGDLLAVLALLTWAGYFIASKSARRHLDTFEYLTVMNITAWVVVTPVAALFADVGGEGRPSWGTAALILTVVLVPGSGHILMNWAHAHTTLVFTSLVTLAAPVLATVAAAVFLDQPITVAQGLGMAVVLAALAGVIVGDSRTRRMQAVAEAVEPAP